MTRTLNLFSAECETPMYMSTRAYTILTTLIDRLDAHDLAKTDVITWGAPIPSFGDLFSARVATVGLNPSNREFLDDHGKELVGPFRRFHTLNSLGLRTWSQADARHLRLILESCANYFASNPYDRWFKRLDEIISGTGASFYAPEWRACHLDLIPYATSRKWMELSPKQRGMLFQFAADTLANLLRDSAVEVLILNGQSVVNEFRAMTGISLEKIEMKKWALPRSAPQDVPGFAYKGMMQELGGFNLGRSVLVLGYNHNVQSSFGVTKEVLNSIRAWVTASASGAVA